MWHNAALPHMQDLSLCRVMFDDCTIHVSCCLAILSRCAGGMHCIPEAASGVVGVIQKQQGLPVVCAPMRGRPHEKVKPPHVACS